MRPNRGLIVVAVMASLVHCPLMEGANPSVPPNVSITYPADGFATNDTNLTVTVVFAPSDGTGNVQDVDLLLDGQVVATYHNPPQTKQGTNTFNVNVAGGPDRVLRIQACAYQGNRKANLRGCSAEIGGVIDRTPPTIAGSVEPAVNARGWNKTDVTVHFTAADAGSGIASVTPDVVVSAEGAGQAIAGTATDKAGNVATTSVTVNLDKTAPAANAAVSPQANANGWHRADVMVHFTGADALSGIESVSPDVLVTSEGASQVITGTVTDKADNTATAPVTVNLDKTAPSISASITPKPNAAGWVRSAATVHFAATDTLSDVESVTSDVVVTARDKLSKVLRRTRLAIRCQQPPTLTSIKPPRRWLSAPTTARPLIMHDRRLRSSSATRCRGSTPRR